MSVIIILILSLLCSFEIIESSQSNYRIKNGVNIIPNIGASWIISSMRKENHIFCLAACNKNQECLSTIYIESETLKTVFYTKSILTLLIQQYRATQSCSEKKVRKNNK
jgi:hypothetical protein